MFVAFNKIVIFHGFGWNWGDGVFSVVRVGKNRIEGLVVKLRNYNSRSAMFTPAETSSETWVILILGAGRIVGADQNTVWIFGADHTVHEFSKRSHGLESTRGKLYKTRIKLCWQKIHYHIH